MNTYTVTLELIHPTYPTDEEWYFEGTYEDCCAKIRQRLQDMEAAKQEGIVRLYRGTEWDVENCLNEFTVHCHVTIEQVCY